MSVYVITFIALALAGGFLAYTHHKSDFVRASKEVEVEAQDAGIESSASLFRRNFLIVYLLVMASDWLQGPYIYTLYKDEKGLQESVVAALYATGFVAAAISASFIGSLADKYGRKRFCLVFCGVYAISCISMVSNDLITLFVGRILGGVGTTLIYSVFESWMITEYAARGLGRSSLSMSSMFGTMTTLNGLVAIMSGVVGEGVVSLTKTKTSPFIAAIICLALAAFFMYFNWTENHGDSGNALAEDGPAAAEKSGLQIIRSDKRILILGLISTCVEGSMYLFVFFWSSGLKASAAISHPAMHKTHDTPHHSLFTRGQDPGTNLPFGLIFATFMASMMLGSLVFSLSSRPSDQAPRLPFRIPFSDHPAMQRLSKPTSLLTATIAVASFSLFLPLLVHSESITFWSFCLFEASIGIYFPSMFSLKASLIPDGVRAKVYTIMRVPLNIFVVGAHSLSREGDAHRHRIFLSCSILLAVAGLAASRYLNVDSERPSHKSAGPDDDVEVRSGTGDLDGDSSSDQGAEDNMMLENFGREDEDDVERRAVKGF